MLCKTLMDHHYKSRPDLACAIGTPGDQVLRVALAAGETALIVVNATVPGPSTGPGTAIPTPFSNYKK